jgi:ElaB/YqjD/DUF883 family membrane-anchored ribosome-binding protein
MDIDIDKYKETLIEIKEEKLVRAEILSDIDGILKSKQELLKSYLRQSCGSEQGTIREIISSHFEEKRKSIKDNSQIKDTKKKVRLKQTDNLEENLILEVEEYILENKIYMDMKL